MRTDAAAIFPWLIQPLLATTSFGRRFYYMHEVDSTNRVAADLARGGEREGTVVVSDFQTAGRGRRRRQWVSPRGRNLLFSIILRPEKAPLDVLPLTLHYSLALAELLTDCLKTRVMVKWPNDVVTAAGKLCGILAESTTTAGRTNFVVMGIGINVNMSPDEVPGGAASCRSLTGSEHDRRRLFADTLGRLEEAHREYSSVGFAAVVNRYAARLSMMDKRIAFRRGGREVTGDVAGIAEDGGLRVRTLGQGTITLYDEEITIE